MVEVRIIKKQAIPSGNPIVGFMFKHDGTEYASHWEENNTNSPLPCEEAVYNNALHTIAELMGGSVKLTDIMFVPEGKTI